MVEKPLQLLVSEAEGTLRPAGTWGSFQDGGHVWEGCTPAERVAGRRHLPAQSGHQWDSRNVRKLKGDGFSARMCGPDRLWDPQGSVPPSPVDCCPLAKFITRPGAPAEGPGSRDLQDELRARLCFRDCSQQLLGRHALSDGCPGPPDTSEPTSLLILRMGWPCVLPHGTTCLLSV